MITCITFVRPFVGPPWNVCTSTAHFFTLSDIIKTLLSRKASPISFGKRLFTSLNCKATVAIFPYLPMKSHIPHFRTFASLYSFCIKFILRLSYFGPNWTQTLSKMISVMISNSRVNDFAKKVYLVFWPRPRYVVPNVSLQNPFCWFEAVLMIRLFGRFSMFCFHHFTILPPCASKFWFSSKRCS